MNNLKIKDICNNISDGNYSSKYPRNSEFISEGIPFIRANNLKKGTVIWDDMRFISPEKHAELKKGHLKEKDVLVTTRGNIGTISLVPKEFEDANINAQIVRLECNPKIVMPEYLKLVMNTSLIQNQLLRRTSGTALKQLPVGELQDVEIPIIPLETQKHIVSILERAEKLKEKRQITNEDTNKITQSVFYEMFGDPVKNEKGWDVVELNQLSDILKNTIHPEKIENKNELKYLGLEHIESNTGNIIKQLDLNDIELKSTKFQFDENCILYGKLRPYLNKIALPNFKGVCSTDILPIKAKKSKSNKFFLAYLLKNPYYINKATEMSQGANLPRISPKVLDKFMVFSLPIELQNQFAEIVQKIESLKEKQKLSSDDINILFDALMQKAFKGELVE